MYVKQQKELRENVIFVDESKYNIFYSDSKRNVWQKPNTAKQVKNLRPIVKYGSGHQMIWGCLANSGDGNLHFIDGTMNKYVYLDILK